VDNSNEPLAESVTSAKESLAGQSLWADARASASERSRGIPWLVWNYIWRNWFLGNLLRWAPRFATLAIHRARGVKVGLGCFIDPSAIMETAFPENISIGDDVRIAAAAVIMTHIKPPHYLRQTGIMDSVIKPVRIEDHVFIGVSAVLAPGVVVGKAAVVANGAVVVNNVPPFTMVAGNPAAVVKRFTKPMDNG
jgi:acetyltransferase-like isoleucine patch superfamily enzyme